jgi:MOSC domain-containing protein YiiM
MRDDKTDFWSRDKSGSTQSDMHGSRANEIEGRVFGLARHESHRFSKLPIDGIVLVKGHGVEGDAHAGTYVRHRYLARTRAQLPNLRQVHLLPFELLESLRKVGFDLQPGDLGENVATSGLTLEKMPLGTILQLGSEASVELTGLRTPCALLNRFRAGLKRQMIGREPKVARFRCGVMAIVRESGRILVADPILVRLPPKPWSTLPPL